MRLPDYDSGGNPSNPENGCVDQYGSPMACSLRGVAERMGKKKNTPTKEPIGIIVPDKMPKPPFADPKQDPSTGLAIAKAWGGYNGGVSPAPSEQEEDDEVIKVETIIFTFNWDRRFTAEYGAPILWSPSPPAPPGPCETMADRAQIIADKHLNKNVFKAVSEFDKEFATVFVGVPIDSKKNAIKAAFHLVTSSIPFAGQSDFKAVFQEAFPPDRLPPDQTHHFAAFFSAGINGQWAVATAHMIADDNPADKILGNAAYQLGSEFNLLGHPNPSAVRDKLKEVGATIKKEICDIKP